jgi:hypothetical protein
MAWTPPKLNIIGNNDPKVSPYLKAWVMQRSDAGETSVCGVIGEGTTRELQANWNTPFEQESIGGKFQRIGGIAQAETGLTSQGQYTSRQIWEGNRPHVFNLVLKFYALYDAKKEVMEPLRALEEMAAPRFFEIIPGGRVPQEVAINIGRISLLQRCLITAIQTPLDKEKTRDGHLVRAEVTLTIETVTMLDRRDIRPSFGS